MDIFFYSTYFSNKGSVIAFVHSTCVHYYTVAPQITQSIGHATAEQWRTIPSLNQLAILSLMHLRLWLTLLVVRLHCWFIFNLLSTRTLKFLSMRLLYTLSCCSLYVYPGLSNLICRISQLLSWDFIQMVIGPDPQLVKISLQGFSSEGCWLEPTAPPSLVSSTNLVVF